MLATRFSAVSLLLLAGPPVRSALIAEVSRWRAPCPPRRVRKPRSPAVGPAEAVAAVDASPATSPAACARERGGRASEVTCDALPMARRPWCSAPPCTCARRRERRRVVHVKRHVVEKRAASRRADLRTRQRRCTWRRSTATFAGHADLARHLARRCRTLHDPAADVVLAVPLDLLARLAVQNKAERALARGSSRET